MQIFLSLSLSLSVGVPHFSSLDLCCRRAMELSLVIRQTLEAAILTHLMPRSQVKSLAGFVPREWKYQSGLLCSCDNFCILSFLDLWIEWKYMSYTHKTVNAGTAHVVHALQHWLLTSSCSWRLWGRSHTICPLFLLFSWDSSPLITTRTFFSSWLLSWLPGRLPDYSLHLEYWVHCDLEGFDCWIVQIDIFVQVLQADGGDMSFPD